MKLYFEKETVDIIKVEKDLKSQLDSILEGSEILNAKKDLIVIKPNIHKDMNALMGNTTDLRILAGLIESLHRRGYYNIVVAEGSNCGIYRFGINAYKRLGLIDLLEYLKVKFVDMNNSSYTVMKLPSKDEIQVSKIVLENDILINVPKLKTHHLTGLSVCLKSVMGAVKGMNKRIMHNDLYSNIIELNEIIRSDLHIVDALVSMEGQGPGMGIPVLSNSLIAGKDPYIIDTVCARFAGFKFKDNPLLLKGKEKDRINKDIVRTASKLKPFKKFIQAEYTLKNKVVDNKYFIWLRNLTRPIFDNEMMSQLLFLSGIREDEFVRENAEVELTFNKENCVSCGTCKQYCPISVDVNDSRCVKCLYCYWVCRHKAIDLSGKKGFLTVQIEKYKKIIEKLVN